MDADEKYREADDRYRFMQSLRAYTRDLCECLTHKIADVEALEEERLAAMRELYADARRARDEVRRAFSCSYPCPRMLGLSSHITCNVTFLMSCCGTSGQR